MRLSDLALLALVQLPNACLAGAGLYLAVNIRTRGAVVVASSLCLTLLLSIAENFIPNSMRTVFDESGQIAVAIETNTDPYLWLGYVGTGLRVFLAVGLVLLAVEWRRASAVAVSPNNSFERTREG